ncbi:hypothetical protein H2200_011151 [Cladophialophora chaetospira]|uniref:Uncharacterized protein n=1 Tax=Cladophialophora chaetospira TaxID=386627 RepID=A0AA38X028_9EURO|nr:hypothetical protein H2200_011151 [Cladophialophora chaetospira]
MFGSGLFEWAIALILTFLGSILTFLFSSFKQKELGLRDLTDKRLNERMERDSIRKNFDLQRARMPNLQTTELIAFSQAAAAEVNKRREAERIEQVREKEEQAMIDQINRSRNKFVPKAGVYGEECTEVMREMSEIATKQRAELDHDARQMGRSWEATRAFPEPWTQEGQALETRRRRGAVHGGFSARQMSFRDEARLRERSNLLHNASIVDIASEKRHGLRMDGTRIVPHPMLRLDLEAEQRAAMEARKRQETAAQYAAAQSGLTETGSR